MVGDTTRSELTGAQGVTLLKLRVLENGKVGEGHIERSAGHADLDSAAVDAVKRWLFEPARMGTIPVAVWVLLPVKFEIQWLIAPMIGECRALTRRKTI